MSITPAIILDLPVNITTTLVGSAVLSATTSTSITTNSTIISKGICYGSSSNPTISDNVVLDSGTGTTFTSDITGLTQDTTYHVRGWVKKSNGGIFYSSDLSITTDAIIGYISYSVNNTDEEVSTLDVSKPSNTIENDLMIANIIQSNNSGWVNATSSGWSLYTGTTISSASNQHTILYKFAGSSEPTGYTFNVMNSAYNKPSIGISTFRYVNTSNPFDNSTTNFLGAEWLYSSATTISTNHEKSAIVMFTSFRNTGGGLTTLSEWNVSNVGSLTEMYDYRGDVGAGKLIGGAYKVWDSYGSTGLGTVKSDNGTNEWNGSILLSLRNKNR